ncbi:hypothetical protein AR1Y2_3499 [Anaerostipes rhamnosivorans]|uniref:Uncharacterized protein n=1 Tax=Anaerostipes rhamnosivorans TaxID=1229621 RepID=A0A4P8ILG5_9FIRM|nr:hypothetical protein AR1Y2_3499 [Anaerostipes rhamnosivorans]
MPFFWRDGKYEKKKQNPKDQCCVACCDALRCPSAAGADGSCFGKVCGFIWKQ